MALPHTFPLITSAQGGGKLYDFAVNETVYFTVSRSLSNSSASQAHRYGPTLAEVRNWLSGTSNGGQGKSWANTYVSMNRQGYQLWTVGESGRYRVTLQGTVGGFTDQAQRGRGTRITFDSDFTAGDELLIAVGQGVPDFGGDHCNGSGGGTWLAYGNDNTTATLLGVAAGGAGDTSDGGTQDCDTNWTTYTNSTGIGGVTQWLETAVRSTTTSGQVRGQGCTVTGGFTAGGGYLTDGQGGSQTSSHGHGFRSDLIGGTQSNSTAGYGGFGGGSGGVDESGSSSGGFTTGQSQDGPASAASTMINTGHSTYNSGSSISLVNSTSTWQNSDYTSDDQYQGYAKFQRVA